MRTMIAIPCMDMMHSQFVMSLTGLKLDGDIKFAYSVSSLVYDSRNTLARKAIIEQFDYVLWLDSDMEFDPDLFKRLKADLDEGRDMVCGFYVTRKPPIKPVIFDKLRYEHINENEVRPIAHTMYEYPQDDIFEVEGCGFGGVMMKVDLLREVDQKYGLPFSPIIGFGEDISFCMRVRDLGRKIYCDSRVKMGHVGNYTYKENDYVRGS